MNYEEPKMQDRGLPFLGLWGIVIKNFKRNEMEKKRSKGVTILGGFFLFCVIPGLMVSFIGLISGPTYPQNALGQELDNFIRIEFILSPFVFLIEGIGILKLKDWGRIFTIIICSINILFEACLYIVLNTPPDIFNDSVNLAILIFSIGVIYYLTRPKVKEQFK